MPARKVRALIHPSILRYLKWGTVLQYPPAPGMVRFQILPVLDSVGTCTLFSSRVQRDSSDNCAPLFTGPSLLASPRRANMAV